MAFLDLMVGMIKTWDSATRFDARSAGHAMATVHFPTHSRQNGQAIQWKQSEKLPRSTIGNIGA
jgi:hypothetical protein